MMSLMLCLSRMCVSFCLRAKNYCQCNHVAQHRLSPEHKTERTCQQERTMNCDDMMQGGANESQALYRRVTTKGVEVWKGSTEIQARPAPATATPQRHEEVPHQGVPNQELPQAEAVAENGNQVDERRA